MNDVYHVAYLTKSQQASLRGLLFQYLKSAFRSVATDTLLNKVAGTFDVKKTCEQIGDNSWELFKTYNGIVKKLVSFEDLVAQKGKSKVFSLTPAEMNMIIKSIDFYNKNDSDVLSQYQRSLLSKDMDSLEAMCRKSALYQFTYEEIALAKEEKK